MAPLLARPRKTPRLFARAFGAALIGLTVLAAPASAGVLSPDPASSGADDISTSYWVMLVIATIAAVGINAALIAAVLRFRARRGAEPARTRSGRGIQARLAAALAIPVVVIFVLGVILAEQARDPDADEAEPIEISAIGQQWLWRFEYPGGVPGNRTFTYEKLVLPVDTPVTLNVTSTDVIHRWWVPSLGGKVDAIPGQTTETSFVANEEGTFEGHSAQYSGAGYPAMRAEVDVVSQEEYEQFVDTQADDLAAAQRAVQSELETQAATAGGAG
jgi:cytochrome c oxidase subunit 2